MDRHHVSQTSTLLLLWMKCTGELEVLEEQSSLTLEMLYSATLATQAVLFFLFISWKITSLRSIRFPFYPSANCSDFKLISFKWWTDIQTTIMSKLLKNFLCTAKIIILKATTSNVASAQLKRRHYWLANSSKSTTFLSIFFLYFLLFIFKSVWFAPVWSEGPVMYECWHKS